MLDFRTYKAKIREIEDKLHPLDQEVAQGLNAYSEVQVLDSEISSLTEEIERLDKELKNPLFEKYRLAERKRITLGLDNAISLALTGKYTKCSLKCAGEAT